MAALFIVKVELVGREEAITIIYDATNGRASSNGGFCRLLLVLESRQRLYTKMFLPSIHMCKS